MILGLLCLLAGAQEGFDVHGYQLGDPRPDARAPLTFPGAGPSEIGWHGAASLEYADAPWITEGAYGTEVRLDELVAVNAAVGYAPHARVRLAVGAPLYLTSLGVGGQVQPVALGDLRLTAAGTAVSVDALDLALVATAVLPSGPEGSNLGLAGPAGELLATAAAHAGRLRLAGAVGPAFRPNTRPEERPSPTEGGDALLSWAAAGVEVAERAVVGLELRGESAFDQEIRTALGSPIELMLAARHQGRTGAHGFGGLAVSPSRGAGAPALRLVLGGGFGSGWHVEEPAVVAPIAPVAVVTPPTPTGPTAPTLQVTTPDATVWLEHPVCRWVPWADAAEALAALPPGARVLVAAPGHLPRWVGLDAGPVALDPAPAQGGLVVLADPLDQVFVDGLAVPAAPDGVFLATLPEGVHAVRVVGGGREHAEEVATSSGYAAWVRVPRVPPVEVLFEVGQSRLLPRARIALDALAGVQGSWRFELRGSYSEEGDLAGNLALAGQRAEAVRARLVAAGIPADRITVAEPLPPLPGAELSRQRRVMVTPVGSR